MVNAMRSSSIARSALAVPALLWVVACQDLTTLAQSNPGQLAASDVYVPGNAQLLVNGAAEDFYCAYNRYVVGSGLFTDELSVAISNSSNFDYDRRTLTSSASYGTGTCGTNQQPPIYTTLSTARATADTALAKLRGWTDAQMQPGVNRTRLIGQAATYAGYSLVLLGEGMCSAAINAGPELTPAQLFAEAKLRFDAAIQAATTANDTATSNGTANLATLGRARALLDLGNSAAAATDAAKIPAPFLATTQGDAINARRQNYSFFSINQSSYSTVDPSFRSLTIDGAPDPRVAVTDANRNGTTSGTRIFTPNKFPAFGTVMPIARYAEAQLIVAEARVAASDLAGAATAINNARNTRAGMPQYSEAGQTAAQVLAQIAEERRRELFLEGHRLGDIRRLKLTMLPAAGDVFPGGGGNYGTQTCFPLPDVERINNPNIPRP
jgi:starch-binding outer membrane protein, SusD/RagB family